MKVELSAEILRAVEILWNERGFTVHDVTRADFFPVISARIAWFAALVRVFDVPFA